MPRSCFYAVTAVLVLGIITGSFCDFKINELLANKTDIGAFFATYGSYLSYCLYPAAGMCIFLALRKKGDSFRLLAVGAAILIAGVLADNINLWLKQTASRPRYKYLLTLDNPASEFRNWWQMIPNLGGSDDNFKSRPSGNMTIACMMFSLPMLADVCKKRNNAAISACFAFACVYVVLYGYNRIHMTNHFLSDVCFGTLITYLIFAVISSAFMKSYRKS